MNTPEAKPEWKPQVGDVIVVAVAHQNMPVGMVLKMTGPNNSQWGVGHIVDANGSNWGVGQSVNFEYTKIVPSTRSSRADVLERNAAKMETEANAKLADVTKMRADAQRLRAFESDEEELADLLISAQDGKGTRAERRKKLAAVLKGRIKTHQL